MNNRNQPFRFIRKSLSVFILVLWLFTVVAHPKKISNFDYFLSLLTQIETRSYFKPPDETWFSKSLETFFHHTQAKPATKQQYTQILKETILTSPEKESQILKEALDSLINALPDPYAAILTPEEVRTEETEKRGKRYPGFGLLFAQKENEVKLAGTLPGSPAERAGLSAGDVIARIDGRPVRSLQEVIHRIDARKKRSLSLEVIHEGNLIQVSLAPEKIQLFPFIRKQLRRAGYVGMEIILPGDDLEFLRAAGSFEKQKDAFLILDLRNCIGGEVNTAARIAGYLLNAQDVVYYQESRTGRIAYRNATFVHVGIPVYVLTNAATASAAELITAALKDHRRAAVIGETTAGKGTIQTTWPLRDGGALRFTTAVYLRPSGKKVTDVGITPDIAHSWKKGDSDKNLESLIEKAALNSHVMR